MEIPKEVTLYKKPDGYVSHDYKLTIGKKYKTHGKMGSCVVIETDDPNEIVSVHWSRFLPHNAEITGPR